MTLPTRATGLGLTAAPGPSPDGESEKMFHSQTTQDPGMVTVKTVCSSMARKQPKTLTGMMSLAV